MARSQGTVLVLGVQAKRYRSTALRALRVCVLAIFSLLPTAASAVTIGPTPIALSGQAAPTGGNYSTLGFYPVLNDAGQVAFNSDLTGGSSSQGIFVGTAGSLQTVALTGTAAPVSGSLPSLGQYFTFGNVVLNSSGQVAYKASLTSGIYPSGLFVGTPGSQKIAALQGLTTAGGYYNDIGDPALNSSGLLLFNSSLFGGSSSSGIFASSSSGLQSATLQGSNAPQGMFGTYSSFGVPVFNDSGKVAYKANITNVSTLSGIFTGLNGTPFVDIVAFQGNTAPGGGVYTSFGDPVINASGQVAYLANLIGGAGIFAGNPTSVQAVALRGAPAPAGGNYSSFSVPVLNTSGQVAFQSTLTGGSSTEGIFVGKAGSLQAIALKGAASPDGVGNFNGFDFTIALNASGQVAFLSGLNGSGVTTANDIGLYAGSAGKLVKIVREGDIIDVDPSALVDLRTVKTVYFTIGSGGEDGRGMSFNDDGLLVYRLAFTDNSSGIFTSKIEAVPEPATWGFVAFAALGLIRLRRKFATNSF